MTTTSPAITRHLVPGLSIFGLALAAGLSWAPAPAAAAANGVPTSCRFATELPGTHGEDLRYGECMRRTACRQMADAAGQTIYEAGCFGVAPDMRVAALARPTR